MEYPLRARVSVAHAAEISAHDALQRAAAHPAHGRIALNVISVFGVLAVFPVLGASRPVAAMNLARAVRTSSPAKRGRAGRTS